MMITPQDVLKIMIEIENDWGLLCAEAVDFEEAHRNATIRESMWIDLKKRLEQMKVLR